MYADRDFSLVTVSANMPDEKTSVLHFLEKKHATSTNLLFDSDDTEAHQTAFDPHWILPYLIRFFFPATVKCSIRSLGP